MKKYYYDGEVHYITKEQKQEVEEELKKTDDYVRRLHEALHPKKWWQKLIINLKNKYENI